MTSDGQPEQRRLMRVRCAAFERAGQRRVSAYLGRARARTGHDGPGHRALPPVRRADPAGLGRSDAPLASGGAVRHMEGRRPPVRGVVAGEGVGTGLGDAIGSLETAERLESLPRTTEALRTGQLSAPQVREIARRGRASTVGRGRAARGRHHGDAQGPQGPVSTVRAASGSAEAENARYEAVRRTRYFRHWSDVDGAFRGEFKLTPDDGARMLSCLEVRANELFDAAGRPTTASRRRLCAPMPGRSRDSVGPWALETGTTKSRHGPTVVHVRVDAAALRRGYVEDGEVCEIAGVGPVPVATARALLPEAFLKVVIADGVDVVSVSPPGTVRLGPCPDRHRGARPDVCRARV